MRKFSIAAVVLALALGSSVACATKKFVRKNVGETNAKVESMVGTLEETQSRTGRNEKRIAEVDGKVGNAEQRARAAKGVAANAAKSANAAGSRIDKLDKASKRMVYDVALTTDEANFAFGRAELPKEAKARIDDLIQELSADPKNLYIEIEGHTDAVGTRPVNTKVGLARAQAVRRYLYDQYQIPLHKMSIISFGEEKPAATNATRTGRAQNRRVVIRVKV